MIKYYHFKLIHSTREHLSTPYPIVPCATHWLMLVLAPEYLVLWKNVFSVLAMSQEWCFAMQQEGWAQLPTVWFSLHNLQQIDLWKAGRCDPKLIQLIIQRKEEITGLNDLTDELDPDHKWCHHDFLTSNKVMSVEVFLSRNKAFLTNIQCWTVLVSLCV